MNSSRILRTSSLCFSMPSSRYGIPCFKYYYFSLVVPSVFAVLTWDKAPGIACRKFNIWGKGRSNGMLGVFELRWSDILAMHNHTDPFFTSRPINIYIQLFILRFAGGGEFNFLLRSWNPWILCYLLSLWIRMWATDHASSDYSMESSYILAFLEVSGLFSFW